MFMNGFNGIPRNDAAHLQSANSLYAFLSDKHQSHQYSRTIITNIIREWTYESRSDLSITSIAQYNLSITPIATSWNRTCGPNEVITGVTRVTSINTNNNNDTQWIWHCAQLDPMRFHLNQCIDSGSIQLSNDLNDQYSYQCPNHGLVHGIYSEIHSDHTMDRRWGLICCEIQENEQNDLSQNRTSLASIASLASPPGHRRHLLSS